LRRQQVEGTESLVASITRTQKGPMRLLTALALLFAPALVAAMPYSGTQASGISRNKPSR
jgi:hypothetical protein